MNKKIYIVEAYLSDSHKLWAESLTKHLPFDCKLFSLAGKHWKWRMHGAAITLANQINECEKPEVIIASEMMDLALFRSSLKAEYRAVPILLYMHENQLSYPWPEGDPDIKLKRNFHYGFINYSSCLTADYVVFNSEFHKNDFLVEADKLLRILPDHKNLDTIRDIKKKSTVISPGIDFDKLKSKNSSSENECPYILWNHRWEYDKNPKDFFRSLFQIKKMGFDFKLIVCGREMKTRPPIFDEAKEKLKENIHHWGYADSGLYAQLLQLADILPVTSNHDYFGISSVEALYSGATAILPNKLAYPEHNCNGTLYYNSIDEFEKLFLKLITNTEFRKRANPELIKSKYGIDAVIQKWESLIAAY